MERKGMKENKLKTILPFSIPSIIAMLLQTAITGRFTAASPAGWVTSSWEW